MELKLASPIDIPIIQDLANIVWPHTFAHLMTQDQLKYMMDMMYSTESIEKQMADLNHCYLLVKDEDEYIGYLSYEINYKQQSLTKIHKIYVLPRYQGKGVGKYLIQKALMIAKEHHNNVLTLNVKRDNKAIQFYESQGFEIAGTEDIDIGDGYLMQDYVMNKKII